MPTAGKPFGWSVVMLKDRIYRRLAARGVPVLHLHFRTERIYERIMRDYPSFAQYCEAKRAIEPAAAAPVIFTVEQLEHIVDLWREANDPLSRSVAETAALMLSTR